jgi:hypothetical protein
MLSAVERMRARHLLEVRSIENSSSELLRPFYFETRM